MAVLELRTLRDHASLYRLHADCPACRHHAVLNPLRLAQAAGWDAQLSAVRLALRCSKCGSGNAELRIIHDGHPSIGS